MMHKNYFIILAFTTLNNSNEFIESTREGMRSSEIELMSGQSVTVGLLRET